MPKKKQKKSQTSSTAAVSVLPAAVSVDQGSFENFKQEMVSYEVLASTLNKDRCSKFNELLRDIASPELQTRLLDLAYCFNDADAIQVLLRANQFLDKDISIVHCHTFLQKPLYYSVDFQQDEQARVVFSRLKEIYSQRLDKLNSDDLKKLIRHPAFQLKDIQDEYLINRLFSAFLEIGEELDLNYLRQDLFVHACAMGFKAIVDFCIRSSVLPDLDRVPLVTTTHSPLAYYALSSQVNREDIKTYLLEKWNEDISLSAVSALELLALCYLLGGLEDIKTQLHTYLKDQEIKAILPQLLVGDLLVAFVEHNPEIRQELDCKDFQEVIENTLSAGLFKWARGFFIQEFNLGTCVGNIIEKFNEELNPLNGLDEQYCLRQYANFFESIVALLVKIDAGYVEFLLALFIVENREATFSILAERYSDILKEMLSHNFSERISLRFFKVESIYPLKAALSYDSREVALSMYRYMHQHELSIPTEAVDNFSSDLLNILMNEPKPDHSFISYFLKNFPEVYCDTLTIEKLLALCLDPALPKPDLLVQVVSIAAHYFYDEFFNLRNPHFDEKQLESLHNTFDALTKDLERSEDVRSGCNAIRLKLFVALSWEKLKNDPLVDLSDESRGIVENQDLHYLCDSIRLAEAIDKKQNWQGLAIRRIFHLHKTNPGLLNTELSEFKSYTGIFGNSQDAKPCTVVGLLARSEISDDILALLLILCPNLDLNENLELDSLRSFPMLCFYGHANIIEQFMEHVIKRADAVLHQQLFYGAFSPVYIAAQYGLIADFAEFKKRFDAISPGEFSKHKDTAKIQVAAYFDGNLDNQGEFKEITDRLESDKWKMLPVAMGLRDSVLVLTALKVQHENQIPSKQQREELIKLLFLSPNLKLLSLLELKPADILKKRNYSEVGYLIELDGLNFCLSRLELALNSEARKSAIDYCGLVANLFREVEVSTYQLEVFLSLLERISAINDFFQKLAEGSRRQIFSYKESSIVIRKVKLKSFLMNSKNVSTFVVKGVSLSALQPYGKSNKMASLSEIESSAIKKLLENRIGLPEGISVLELCSLLKDFESSLSARKQLVDELKSRISSYPKELKSEASSPSIFSLLIDLQQEELVTMLLRMSRDNFNLGDSPDKTRFFVKLCEQGVSSETLNLMIGRIPKKTLGDLGKVVTLSSSRGSSPLYVFYQITQRHGCIDFLLNNVDRLNNCSDFHLLELLALVVEWLQDERYAKEYKEKLKAIESKLLALMAAEEIHIMTALRQYYFLNPRIFVSLLSDNPALTSQVEDAKIEWFFNAALCQLHVPSVEKIFQNIKNLKLSFNLMRVYHWIDGTNPSTPLAKIFQIIANKKESIDKTIAILMALLKLVGISAPAVQSELKNILIKLISSGKPFMKIVELSNLSQEIIKELLSSARQHKHSEVLSLEGYQKEQSSASSAQQPEEEKKESEELIEQQQVVEEDKRRDNDRRQAKQDDINASLVKPLSFLHDTVIEFAFNEEAKLSDLQRLQGNINSYRTECTRLVELASKEDSKFVGHLLEGFNIKADAILEKLQGLEIQVDAKIEEYRRAAEELDRQRLAEEERRRQEASLLAEQKKLKQKQLAKERKFQQKKLAKEIKIKEEQQRSLEEQNELNFEFIQRLESLESNVEDLYCRIAEAIDKPSFDDKAELRVLSRFKEDISFYNQEYLSFLYDLDAACHEAGKEFVICDLDAYKEQIQFRLDSLEKLDKDVDQKIKEIEQAAQELQQQEIERLNDLGQAKDQSSQSTKPVDLENTAIVNMPEDNSRELDVSLKNLQQQVLDLNVKLDSAKVMFAGNVQERQKALSSLNEQVDSQMQLCRSFIFQLKNGNPAATPDEAGHFLGQFAVEENKTNALREAELCLESFRVLATNIKLNIDEELLSSLVLDVQQALNENSCAKLKKLQPSIIFYIRRYGKIARALAEKAPELLTEESKHIKEVINSKLESLKAWATKITQKIKEIKDVAKEPQQRIEQPEKESQSKEMDKSLSLEESKAESKLEPESNSSSRPEPNFNSFVESSRLELDSLDAQIKEAMNYQGVDVSVFSILKMAINSYTENYTNIVLKLEQESGEGLDVFKKFVADALMRLQARHTEIDLENEKRLQQRVAPPAGQSKEQSSQSTKPVDLKNTAIVNMPEDKSHQLDVLLKNLRQQVLDLNVKLKRAKGMSTGKVNEQKKALYNLGEQVNSQILACKSFISELEGGNSAAIPDEAKHFLGQLEVEENKIKTLREANRCLASFRVLAADIRVNIDEDQLRLLALAVEQALKKTSSIFDCDELKKLRTSISLYIHTYESIADRLAQTAPEFVTEDSRHMNEVIRSKLTWLKAGYDKISQRIESLNIKIPSAADPSESLKKQKAQMNQNVREVSEELASLDEQLSKFKGHAGWAVKYKEITLDYLFNLREEAISHYNSFARIADKLIQKGGEFPPDRSNTFKDDIARQVDWLKKKYDEISQKILELINNNRMAPIHTHNMRNAIEVDKALYSADLQLNKLDERVKWAMSSDQVDLDCLVKLEQAISSYNQRYKKIAEKLRKSKEEFTAEQLAYFKQRISSSMTWWKAIYSKIYEKVRAVKPEKIQAIKNTKEVADALSSLNRKLNDLALSIDAAINSEAIDLSHLAALKELITSYNLNYKNIANRLEKRSEIVAEKLNDFNKEISLNLEWLKEADAKITQKIEEIKGVAKEPQQRIEQPEKVSQAEGPVGSPKDLPSVEEIKTETKAASEANFHQLVFQLNSFSLGLNILVGDIATAMNFQGLGSPNFDVLKARINYYCQELTDIDLKLYKESGKDVCDFKQYVAKILGWLRASNDGIDNRARDIHIANQKRQQEGESKLVTEKESGQLLDEMQGQSSEQVQMQQDMVVNDTLLFFENMVENLLELVEIAKDPWVDLTNLQRLKESIDFYRQKYAEVRSRLSQQNREKFNSRIDSQLILLGALGDRFKNYHPTAEGEWAPEERQDQLSTEIEEIEDEKQAYNILFHLNIELYQLGCKLRMAVCFHESGSDNLKGTIVSLRKHHQEIQHILVYDFDGLTPEELDFFEKWVSVNLKFLDRMDAEIDLENKIRFLRGNVTNLVENVKGMSCKNAEELELLKTEVGRFKLSCVLLRAEIDGNKKVLCVETLNHYEKTVDGLLNLLNELNDQIGLAFDKRSQEDMSRASKNPYGLYAGSSSKASSVTAVPEAGTGFFSCPAAGFIENEEKPSNRP